MNNKDIYKALGNIDDDMILEAVPEAVTLKRKKGKTWRVLALVAACFALITISLAVMLPFFETDEGIDPALLPDELKEYADSEYIRLLYAVYNCDDTGKSDYSSVDGDLEDSFVGNPEASSNYVEVTDNQVEGVIEGDLFKRTKTHIFYLDLQNACIRAYKIDGENTKLVSEYSIKDLDGEDILRRHEGMYLSKDGDALIIIETWWETGNNTSDSGSTYNTVVLSFDVSNPQKIRMKDRVTVSGECVDSRSVNGKILLFSSFYVNLNDLSNEAAYIPQIDSGRGFRSIDMKNIVIPDRVSSGELTVLMQIDEDSLKVGGVKVVAQSTNEVFVSENKIVLVDNYRHYTQGERDGEGIVESKLCCDISVIGYTKRAFEFSGNFTLVGSVEGQHSIDEYDGVLRIAATTDLAEWSGDVWLENGKVRVGDGFVAERDYTYYDSNASLYCVDIGSMEIVAEVTNFAPWGEEVISARFDGNMAYVCTAVIVTFSDPVYFFDLSDLNNITYTETGTIEGYSSSLVDFGEGYLLGIGYTDSRRSLKIEVYRENGNKVESVCSFIRDMVNYSEDYKTYFIDREKGLVGLMYEDRLNKLEYHNSYLLLRFDGNSFVELLDDAMNGVSSETSRATLIGDYLYILSNDKIKIVKIIE